MNKIIPALFIIALSACSSQQIKTVEIPDKFAEEAKLQADRASAAPVSSGTESASLSPGKHHFGFGRHHTVIPVKKSSEAEPVKFDNLIPGIARYIKQGIASWYGKKFHGKKTATGEIFDMYALTAAHKTLPIPSYAQVTNLENNKSIIVRINDRGPYVGNRLLDLSYAAAKKLDIQKDGLAKVEVKALLDEQSLSEQIADAEDWENQNPVFLELGTFSSPEKAQKLQNRVASHHLPEPEILPSPQNNATYFKVQIGPIKSKLSADKIHMKLAQLGITAAEIVADTQKSDDTMIQ